MQWRAALLISFALIFAQVAGAADLCQALFRVTKSSTARVLSGPLPVDLKQIFADLDQKDGIDDWQLSGRMGNLANLVNTMTPVQREALREEILVRYNSAPKNEHARNLIEMPRRILDLLIAYDMNPTEFIATRMKKARFWQNKKPVAKAAFIDYLTALHARYPHLKGGAIDPEMIFNMIGALQKYLVEQKKNGGKIRSLTLFGSTPNGLASKTSDLDLMAWDGKDAYGDYQRYRRFAEDIDTRLKELLGGSGTLTVEHVLPIDSANTLSGVSPVMIEVTPTRVSLVLRPVGFNTRFSRGGSMRITPLSQPLVIPIE